VSALKICPTCSTEYPANERFCPRDGTALRAQGGAVGDLVGTIIAERYHVLKKLGEGGMGQVYLAEHVKMGRHSAVKVMNPAMVHDADAIGRFNREASNASRINHPNVAGIYDFGETPEGLVYLAMEYIEGETLTAIVKATGALPPVRAADIARQAAEGLHVAHGMGIVHRDLKPDNIMVSKDRDGLDCVKVVDFGIAKASNTDQKVTRTGMVVGTPEYMSPEQLAGDKLDGRTDLYSLALVTFNMLTGLLPFPGSTAQTSMIMRLTERPKTLADMKPDASWPPELQAVMDKALQREASERYATAREFGRALVAAVETMPVRPSGAAGTVVMEATPAAIDTRANAPSRPDAITAVAEAKKRRATVEAAGETPAKSRMPLLVGGALLAAAVVGGVLFMQRSGKSGAPTGPAATTGAATTAATPPAGSPPAVQQAAVPVSSGGVGVAATPSAPAPAPAVSHEKELRAALEHASSESKAKKALAEADALAGRVTTPEEKVFITMIRAQAYGTLGQDGKSCDVIKDGAPLATGTIYETKMKGMVALCR
jgi:hypothetical protein